MVLFVVFVVLMLNYGWETARNRAVRQERDPDPRNTVLLDDRLGRGMPVNAAVEAARRRLFAPSDDPVIENQRRVTLAAFLACAALLPIWAARSDVVDRVLVESADRGPVALGVFVGSLILAVAAGRILVRSILGPERNFRRGAFAGVLVAASALAFAVSPV